MAGEGEQWDFGRDYERRALLTAALLTEEEKWRFDKEGYLILRGVVSPEKLGRIQALVEKWLQVEDFESLELAPAVVRHRQEPYKTHWEHPQYGDPLFEELNMAPELLRVVAGLLQGAPRLFHSTLTVMSKAAPGDSVGGFHVSAATVGLGR